MSSKVKIYKENEYWGGYDSKGKLNLNLAEKTLIQQASQKYNGNLTKMAKALGIDRHTLSDKLIQHSIKDVKAGGNKPSQENKGRNPKTKDNS